MATRAEGPPLRILAWPALETPNIQPYIEQLYAPMAGKGVRVQELSQRRVLLGFPQLVHAHWPDSLLAQPSEAGARRSLRRLRLLLSVLRLRGIKLLWTAHNLHSHEELHPDLEPAFWDRWTASVDGFVSLSESGVEAVRARFPLLADKPAFVVPHGHYRAAYPPAPSRREAREQLGIATSAEVLLFFGQVRPYKNVPALVRCFRELGRERALLLVAGKPVDEDLEREVREAAGADERVRLELRFIEDERISQLFAAADAVVLPFRDILNSGSALLALSLGRPVLTPAKGAMSELAESVGGDWVSTFEGELEPAILASAFELRRDECEAPDLSAFDWDPLVDRTIEVYRELIGGRG